MSVVSTHILEKTAVFCGFFVSAIPINRVIKNSNLKRYTMWNWFKDILLAIGVIMLVGLILSGIQYFIRDAEAIELKMFPDYAVAFIGAEYDLTDDKITCRADGYNWNGNVGVRQPLLDFGPTRMNAIFQHHSCAFSGDQTDYNAVGINFEFYFGRVFNKYPYYNFK